MKVIFMGTPGFAVTALDAIAASGHEIIAVYCQPAKPAGRGQKLAPSAVEMRARALNIPVYTPKSLKKSAEARAEFAGLRADIAVVAAYGLILPQDVLDAPRYGCLNIHASLLPRWRGAAPIQRAILAGDAETGICIMQMEAGLDTGPVLMRESITITGETTASSLHDALAKLGGRLTVATLDRIAGGNAPAPETQSDDGMTYAAMLTKDDGRIDWAHSAEFIERQFRALHPWPGVWCMTGAARLKILAIEAAKGRGAPGEILDNALTVACGTDAVRLTTVQPEGRKAMTGADFMNGARMKPGDQLS